MSNLPSVVIIGAMKSGTTSLHHYLNLHHEICMSRQKELNFFNKDKNWNKGVEWYRANFVGQEKIYGESSPNYTDYPREKNVPQRMFSVIPAAKLIYVVRNPVERIVSHYIHLSAIGKEHRSIDRALSDFDSNLYVTRSKYYFQLSQFLEFYSPSNILVISSEELSNCPQKTMKNVFQFLEVDAEFKFDVTKNMGNVLIFGGAILNSDFKFNTKLHSSANKRRLKIPADGQLAKTLNTMTQVLPIEIREHAKKIVYLPFTEKIKKPKLDKDLRNRLWDYLSEDIDRLKEFTGRSFPEWE